MTRLKRLSAAATKKVSGNWPTTGSVLPGIGPTPLLIARALGKRSECARAGRASRNEVRRLQGQSPNCEPRVTPWPKPRPSEHDEACALLNLAANFAAGMRGGVHVYVGVSGLYVGHQVSDGLSL